MTTLDETGTEIASPIVQDIWPGRCIHPDGQQDSGVRILLTPGEAVIYGEGTGPMGRKYVYTVRRVPFTTMRPHGRGWVVVGADGAQWTLTDDPADCGCGSTLRYLPTPCPANIPAPTAF